MRLGACARFLFAAGVALCVLGGEAAPKKSGKAPKRAAATARAAKKPAAPAVAQKPVQTPYRRLPYVGAIAADAQTGRILFSDNAERKAYPASVTKMMTALLVLEDIESGKYALTDRATASVRATFEQPSGVGIRPGESMTIDDLLMALMVRSANDAAVVLAENATGGDLPAFIARMNGRAAQLGMTQTKYDSPNGLPPYDAKRRPKKWRHGYDASTARDILKLATALVKHKQIFKYTGTKIAVVTDGAGKPLKSVNHNNILVKDKQKILDENGVSLVDGLKTGYIDAGGSSIALTARKNGHRAIVVVLGAMTTRERDTQARAIMKRALDQIAPGPSVRQAPETPAAAAAPKPAAPAPVAEAPTPAPAAAPAPVEDARETDVARADAPKAGAEEPSEGEADPADKPSALWWVLGCSVPVAAVGWGAWRWLSKDDRDTWNYRDLPVTGENASSPSNT